MPILIIVRHGQSTWNLENRFTGEVDIPLTPLGEEEAKNAGKLLKPYTIHEAFTSVLIRAIRTLQLIEEEMGNPPLPVTRSAALNERNYGDLQGLNKTETEQKYGVEQVLLWRRSFEIKPPGGECLEDTYDRVVPYYKKEIEPKLKAGKNILIVAHGNSLRALMMYLENIDTEEIVTTTLPTGVPRVYELDVALKVLNVKYLR